MRTLILAFVLSAAFAAPSSAAIIALDDSHSWATGTDTIEGILGFAMADVDLSGFADLAVIGAFGTPAGGITLSSTVSKRSVPTTWATWSHGATPDVLFESSTFSILTMPAGVTAFDFYAQPNPFSPFSITATADDGTFVTQTVDGFGGAKYFGFHVTDGTTISLISISSLSPSGFAYGEMRISSSSPIPEPGTLGLGLALVGVFVVRRKRRASR